MAHKDYPAAPGNYKYHTLDDLERLRSNLEFEIRALKGTTDRGRARILEEDERMLNEVEYEILERTLLERGNDGGATE